MSGRNSSPFLIRKDYQIIKGKMGRRVNFSKVSTGGGAKRIEEIEEIQIHAKRKR